jgi:hypothetical protein
MLGLKVSRHLLQLICSFLLGAMLVFTLAFDDKEDEMDSGQLKGGVYGDIRVDIIDDLDIPDHPEFVEALMISKDNYPFIFLCKDSSGKIHSFMITDGENKLALCLFDEGKISEFGIYGNEVHDNKRMPVFAFNASDKPGVWHKVKYIPTVKAIVENGKVKSYATTGELYEDIDFDGQFDAKRIFNKESKIVYGYIFVDGKWLKIDNRDSGEKLQKVGYYSVDRLEAVTFDGREKVYYDFEFGKGWKKRANAEEN